MMIRIMIFLTGLIIVSHNGFSSFVEEANEINGYTKKYLTKKEQLEYRLEVLKEECNFACGVIEGLKNDNLPYARIYHPLPPRYTPTEHPEHLFFEDYPQNPLLLLQKALNRIQPGFTDRESDSVENFEKNIKNLFEQTAKNLKKKISDL